jgi:phosphoribosylanthranilate isomerase
MSRVRIKICGLTRAGDVQAAVRAGADAVGFVFAHSRRRIEADRARELASGVPEDVLRVGLFMDQAAAEIGRILERVPLDLLQFHGGEGNAACRAFGMPFLKAISMSSGNAPAEALSYPDAAGLLFDSHGAAGGGTGRTFDWARIPACPHPVWLAGGLNPANVAEAIRVARPWAVDVSSGVEDAPGVKNAAMITEFIEAARSAQSL